MTPVPSDGRTLSRRSLLIAAAAGGAALTGGAARAGGLPSGARVPRRAAAGHATAVQAAAPDVGVNSVQGPPAGSSLALSQNWDFGTSGNIGDIATMNTVFQYHDQFGTFNNGNGNYGADTVAPDAAHALSGQPVEDPASPVRAFTADSLQTFLVPLNGATTVNPPDHNVGCGSFVSQFTLPAGGSLLGQHLMWETRLRYVVPPYYWLGLWASGNIWDNGAEMDLIESFGYDNGGGVTNFNGDFWHCDSVGGTDHIGYGDWPSAMASVGVTDFDPTQYHVWQWWYFADDSFAAVMDGIVVQTGHIHWTDGASDTGTPIDMRFLFDGAWGHTQVASVDHSLPASDLEGKLYEWDYSRIYLSDPAKTGWQPLHSLGGSTPFAPAVASQAPGDLDLFNFGGGGIWHNSFSNGSWASGDFISSPPGGPLAAAPAAISSARGFIDIFGLAADQRIWRNSYDASTTAWSGWVSLGGGPFTSAPAVSSWAAGRIDLFAIDASGSLLHGSIDSTDGSGWSGWTDNSLGLPPGGPLTSDPAAVSASASVIDVFARGADNALWANTYASGTWSGWTSLGGTLTSGPGAASWAPGRIDVFALSTDSGLWQITNNAGWGEWTSRGASGSLASAPAAVSWSIGRTDVFIRAADSTIRQVTYS